MIDFLVTFLSQLWHVCEEASPWLLLGIVVSGLIKAWLPTSLLERWLGGRGVWPVFKAAVIGTPLPLCSCSVIPAAVALRRSGASKGATVSFLVSTPENGADSIAVSYALLGPFMTIVRPVAAIISAVLAGLLSFAWVVESDDGASGDHGDDVQAGSCCSSGYCGPGELNPSGNASSLTKLGQAWHFAVDELFADIAGWMAVGLVLAALMNTLVPPDTMAGWGSGLLPMLAVMVVGVPMYICATASTPVAASMLLAGVSPGTVLVFLLAGPATNLATIGVVRRELGGRAVASYLLGVCGGALVLGLVTDGLVGLLDITVSPAKMGADSLIPHWLAYASFAVLAGLSLRVMVRAAHRRLSAGAGSDRSLQDDASCQTDAH